MSSAVNLYEHVLGFKSMKDIGLSLAVACSFIYLLSVVGIIECVDVKNVVLA